MESSKLQKLSFANVLVALGIIYGDIGTSPIYTMKFIVGDRTITEDLILGDSPVFSGHLH
jgi:KUP system potassium uptake protein